MSSRKQSDRCAPSLNERCSSSTSGTPRERPASLKVAIGARATPLLRMSAATANWCTYTTFRGVVNGFSARVMISVDDATQFKGGESPAMFGWSERWQTR